MANIKKNFNFRNGVQVDDDNLLVTSTGLVGIGTTVPTEALDVRGNVKIIGDATITNATVGVLTITNVVPTQIIGAGVSIVSGIVTAQGSGIVTFFGDARFLQGMPTSQWEDTNAGLGVSSIYNTGGTVGIATTNPQFALQVGENPNQIGGVSGRGVGISSVGNVNASGIISATTFKGSLIGDVTGNVVGLVTGNITGDVVGNIIGVSTGTHNGPVNLAPNQDLKVGAGLTIASNSTGSHVTFFNNTEVQHILEPNVTSERWSSEIQVGGSNIFVPQFKILRNAGVELYYANGGKKLETATSGINVSGTTTTGQLSVTGVSTFGGIIEGVAGQNKIPFLYSSMTDLPSAGSYHGAVAHVHATGSLYYAHAGQWWELVNKESDGRVGTGTEVYNIASINSSGIITATELNAPSIGVGTITPANDIHVRKPGNVEIQVTSDTGVAGLTVGRESGTNNTNNAEFRYGGGLGASYSSSQSLDIINYGIGNFNYHLSAANATNVDGDFHWHKGLNNTRLMTLTGVGGSLGIGITTPSSPLHVLGDGIISGDLTIGGDLNPAGDFNGNVIGNISGTLTGNVNATSGVSTFLRLNVDDGNYSEFGQISATGVGIGTTMADKMLLINSAADARFSVSTGGNVGIRTDNVPGSIALLVGGDICSLETVGVGTNVPRSAIDFADAGQTLTGAAANRMFMVPPKVGAAQTAGLVSLVAGAMIYNTTLNKLQVYNGTNWETITSVEVTG